MALKQRPRRLVALSAWGHGH